MKTLVRIASYVVMLGVGLVIGLYCGSRYKEARSFAFDAAEITHYSAYMKTQMVQGTDASLEEAIRGFLALIEKRKGHQSPWLTEKVFATDAALSNARLAALAQKRGATQEAQQYLNRAASFCPQLGWKECSAEKITSMVQRLDKEGIFKPSGAK